MGNEVSRAEEEVTGHFLHPSHPVRRVSRESNYRCNGCRLDGAGSRYRCERCDFDLHDLCAKCPRTLQGAHRHPLELYVRDQQGVRWNTRPCGECEREVEGMYYWCRSCDLVLHPLCAEKRRKRQEDKRQQEDKPSHFRAGNSHFHA